VNIEDFRTYCLNKKGVSEGFPFGGDTLVFKVMGKIFALTNVDNFDSVNLKCDPERALALRAVYSGIIPGYHMNKKHWNTIANNSDVDDKLFFELIDNSYELVKKSLTKKLKEELENY
jgi:predicted DNA-binding protein (MmcQ/YjbR family)